MPSPADFVKAGQAAAAAKGDVLALGGTGMAASRAASAAFADALKNLERPTMSASNVTKTLAGSMRELERQGMIAQYAVHRLRMAVMDMGRNLVGVVEKANPAAVIRFTIAMDALAGVMGRILLPLLENVTMMIQKFADNLFALGPAGKQLIQVFVGFSLAMLGVAAGVIAATVAASALAVVIDALTGGLAAIFQVIGASLGLMAGAGVGAFMAVGTMADFRQALDAILPALAQVVSAMAEGLMPVFQAIIPLVLATANYFGTVMTALLPLIKRFAENLKEMITPLIYGSLIMAELIKIAAGFFGNKPAEAPGRAPPAVRPVQTGDIGSFITRQWQSALQGMPQQQGKSDIQKIQADVEKIRAVVVGFTGGIGAGKEIGKGVATFDFSRVAVAAANRWHQIRDGMRAVGGK